MSILAYHAVDPGWPSQLSMHPTSFARHVEWLARHRSVVPLDVALSRVRRTGSLPEGMTSITFDDGFASVYDHALPVLRRFGMPATVFIVGRTLEGATDVDWVDDGTVPMTLSGDQILEMRDVGIAFGSHGYSHRSLTGLDDLELERELRDSRVALEDLLRRPVTSIAYPRAISDDRVRRVARRCGYRYGLAVSLPRQSGGPMEIARAGVYAKDGTLALRVKSSTWYLPLRTMPAYARVRRPFTASRGIGSGPFSGEP
jgi:peptidoglycan/xylan/chitin deacetylase (PgdA/CDA1 family)